MLDNEKNNQSFGDIKAHPDIEANKLYFHTDMRRHNREKMRETLRVTKERQRGHGAPNVYMCVHLLWPYDTYPPAFGRKVGSQCGV